MIPHALPTPPRLATLALLATLLGGCNRGETTDAAEPFASVKRREPARVLVEPLARREMLQRLETTTRVESESHVLVFPRAAGVVVELLVEEGRHVEQDAVLARLDSRDARLRLEDARAALKDARDNLPKLELATRESQTLVDNAQRASDQAEREHERNLAISQGGPDTPGLISSKDLDASRLARDRARGELESARLAHERALVERQNGDNVVARAEVAVARAELDLSFTDITAPVAGVVAERAIKLGDSVSSAASAFTLTDLTRLRAVFHRPQRELELFGASFGAGNGDASAPQAEIELRARAEALPGKTFVGRIERVAPTIDPASGAFRVTAQLDGAALEDARARLLPGMLVRLEIVTDRRPDALTAPKRAVRREGDRSTIQVVEDGVARTVEVAEGFSDEEWIEVTARGERALAAGELVIVVGNRDLEDGAEVIASDAGGAIVSQPARQGE